MARILVVEDEPDLREVVVYNLRGAGHTVEAAGTIREALRLVERERFELVVLDLMLPDGNGGELCRRVKGDPQLASTRVLMLTAKGGEIDRIVGFELGADDYVVKPFSVRELALRVQAVLRRAEPDAAGAEAPVVVGPLVFDRARHRALVDGVDVGLTALEFKLLGTLLDRRGRVQTRERLLEDVWEVSPEITTRTVDTHVKRLREKLGVAGASIETVRGVGYRFAEAA